MAIRKSRGRLVVEFQQGGERVFRRLPPGITQAQARELETKLRREIFDRGPLSHQDEITLPAAIGLWLQSNRRKNQRQAVSEARQWEPFVGGKLLREAPEVAQEAVGRWKIAASRLQTSSPATAGRAAAVVVAGASASRRSSATAGRAAGASGSTTANSTINRRLALMKAVCKHAYKQGLITENLSGRISLLREDNKREVYLTRAEVMRLARCSPTRGTIGAAIIIAAYTGLRASELLALPAITTQSATLTVARSKTGKPRVVPVPPSARRYLSALPLGLSYWQLHNGFLAAREAAGMPHVRFHDLRHTTASWLINSGVDLYTVGKILGHSGPQTTARYAHLSTATLEQAMRRLK